MLRSVAMRNRLQDRRSTDRPSNGDTALCPKCGIGAIEFNERYRVRLPTGKIAAIPAWVCDRPECRYERPARRSSAPLVKARAVLRHARSTLTKTLGRKKD
jgi:hypothetical protein